MKAIVWQGPNEMTVEEQPDPPDPGPGELILRPEAVGHLRLGGRGLPRPHGQPHAAAGDGPRVRGRAWSPPARAPRSSTARASRSIRLSGCGECRLCRAGHTNLCRDRVLVGVHVPGAFADFVKVRAADARVLPDGVSSRDRRADGAAGQRRARRAAGAAGRRARGRDRRRHDRARHAAGRAAGRASRTSRSSSRTTSAARGRSSLGASAPSRAPGEADLVLDAVGAEATRRLGLELLRPGGTMVCIGLANDDTTLGFHDVVRSQHRIQGSYAYTMPDFEQAHEWLVSGQAHARRRPDRGAAAGGRAGAVRAARRGPAAARVQGLPGRRGARGVSRTIVVVGASSGIGARHRARVRRRRRHRPRRRAARDLRGRASPRTGSTSPTARRWPRSRRRSTRVDALIVAAGDEHPEAAPARAHATSPGTT